MVPAFVAVTAALVGALLAVERRPGPLRGWVKAAASTSFIAVAVVSDAGATPYGRWVLAALALSWVGDVALVSARRTWFLVGLGAFLTAHLGYAAGFVARGVGAAPSVVAGAVLVAPAAVVLRWLWARVPAALRRPVIAYVVVITAMVAMAVGTAVAEPGVVVIVAAAAFYLSDLFVARDRFVTPGFVNRMVGLPLYYLAQVLFALSV